MIIDTKFNRGDLVCFMSGDRICRGTIKEIEVHISLDYEVEPTIIYKLSEGYHLVNPRILCSTRQEVADELLKQE